MKLPENVLIAHEKLTQYLLVLRKRKVWLQHDSTDAEIAKTLVEMGIPANHIVLGFQPEHYRQHSGFAVK